MFNTGAEKITNHVKRSDSNVFASFFLKSVKNLSKICTKSLPSLLQLFHLKTGPQAAVINVLDETFHQHHNSLHYTMKNVWTISEANCGVKMPVLLSFSILLVDDFTREFWSIYETVRNEGIIQVSVKRLQFNCKALYGICLSNWKAPKTVICQENVSFRSIQFCFFSFSWRAKNNFGININNSQSSISHIQ